MLGETISTAARASARASRLSSKPPNILLGGVGRHARRITSELLAPPALLLLVLLLRRVDEHEEEGTEEDEDEDGGEVDEEEDAVEDACSAEYLGSGKLVCGRAKACLPFSDIIIIITLSWRQSSLFSNVVFFFPFFFPKL